VSVMPVRLRGLGLRGLACISGLCAWPNPVFVREFRVRLRGLRGNLLILGYVGLVAVVVAMVYYFGIEVRRHWGGGAITQEELGDTARGAVIGAWITQVLLLGAVLPGMLGGSVATERMRLTLEQLVMTPLRPRTIIFGKFNAAALQALYLIIASIPVIAVCFLVGGVSWAGVLPGAVVSVTAGLLIAAESPFFSALCRSPVTGVILSYVFVAIYYMGVPMGESLVVEALNSYGHHSGPWSDPVSLPFVPWMAVTALLEENMMGSGYWLASRHWWMASSSAALAGTLVALAGALAAMARVCRSVASTKAG